MIEHRRPSPAPSADGGILGEVIFIAGAVWALYFAAYLYELGFLWRLGLPIALAEIGFSRSLALVATAIPAGCCLVGGAAWLKTAAGTAPVPTSMPASIPAATPATEASALASITLAAMGVCAAALVAGALHIHFVDAALLAYVDSGFGVLASLVFLGGIVCLALHQRHVVSLFARAEPGRIALSSLLLLLLFALPVGLGWRGAEAKEGRPRTFLYLVGSDDLALVRLYPDKAIFLSFDRETGRFGSEYLVQWLGQSGEAEIIRELELR